MSNDYARATGQPRPIELGGKTYQVPILRPAILGELSAWLKEVVPDPRVIARQHMEGLPDEVQKAMWLNAVEEARYWPPSVNSTEGKERLVSTYDGQVRTLYALLRRTTAGFTQDDAQSLAETMSSDDFDRLFELATPGELGDPKAPATQAVAT